MSQVHASVTGGAHENMSEELEVLRIVTERLEAEGIPYMVTGSMAVYREVSRFADEVEDFDLSEDEADAGLAEGYLVRIEPLKSSMEYGWMVEFARLGDGLAPARSPGGRARRPGRVPEVQGRPRALSRGAPPVVPVPRRARAGGDAGVAGGPSPGPGARSPSPRATTFLRLAGARGRPRRPGSARHADTDSPPLRRCRSPS